MKGFGSKKKSKNKKINNLRTDNFKEQIIYKAFKFHSEGNISESDIYQVSRGKICVIVNPNLLI